MKVKDGKLKLDKRDVRIGNFVVTDEENHYKVQDINGQISHRFAKETLIGRALPVMLKQEDRKFLSVWISALYSAFSVVPDAKFLEDVISAVNACIMRHKDDFYGGNVVSDAEDEKILREQKMLHEDYGNVKKDTAAQSSE